MTEYIVVVALVAVAAIAVYQYFGQVVRSQTAAMARELAGEDGGTESRAAQQAAKKAAAQTKARSLKSFTGNAAAAK
jgi:Tfp pilus assembly major pilin PilA